MDDSKVKTGTTTVGIMCKDCVVLAADMRATAGHLIMDKKVEKVLLVNNNMALTMAGSVSDIQRLIRYLRSEIRIRELKTLLAVTVKEAANLLSHFVYNNLRSTGGVSHFLFAGLDTVDGVTLYDVFADGTLMKIDDYVTSGSGSVFALGVLEAKYKEGFSEKEGVDLAVEAINAALARDTASGNGINVVVINKNGAKKVLTRTVSNKVAV